PAAVKVRACDVVGVASAVEEDERLCADFEGAGKGSVHGGANQVHATIFVLPLLLAEVDHFDNGQLRSGHAIREAVQGIAAFAGAIGVVPAFERWRCAAKDDGAACQLCSAYGDIAAVVSWDLVLFV